MSWRPPALRQRHEDDLLECLERAAFDTKVQVHIAIALVDVAEKLGEIAAALRLVERERRGPP